MISNRQRHTRSGQQRTAGAYPGFRTMDASPSQVTPSISSPVPILYSWVDRERNRESIKVSCTRTQHNDPSQRSNLDRSIRSPTRLTIQCSPKISSTFIQFIVVKQLFGNLDNSSVWAVVVHKFRQQIRIVMSSVSTWVCITWRHQTFQKRGFCGKDVIGIYLVCLISSWN